jgi:energy-coupling factor transporter ATP-binding protein EcfA2
MITSVIFDNFKILDKYSISISEFNILVGINNSGKSTILDAFRILFGVYRFASRVNPTIIDLPTGKKTFGWIIPESSIPILLENVQTNFSDEPAIIKYRFGTEKYLILYFSKDRPVMLTFSTPNKEPRTATEFRKEFGIKLAVIPTLGPFEIEEDIVDLSYLNRWSGSRRASRLFRNIWYQDPADFQEFRTIVEQSWPGMSINPPEKLDVWDKKLTMFFMENRLSREICWAGFGFQVWLQLLTHIIKNKNADFIIVDEPEIYLHPDLQHKILDLLKNTNAKVIIATHSVEIINEAEPNEVLLIDPASNSAKRLSSVPSLQKASELIGSNQNIHLTRLARGKKILFVEGKDLKILDKLAKQSGFKELFEKNNLTVIPIEGFSQNERISATNWTFSKIISEKIKLAGLFDRDYRCDDEVKEFIERLEKDASFIHVLTRKEIENYLIVPRAIKFAINEKLRKTTCNQETSEYTDETIIQLITELAENFKIDVSAQLAAHRYRFVPKNTDLATVILSEQQSFEKNWQYLDFKISKIPGKEFLAFLNTYLQGKYGFSITSSQIISKLDKADIDIDLLDLFKKITTLIKSI